MLTLKRSKTTKKNNKEGSCQSVFSRKSASAGFFLASEKRSFYKSVCYLVLVDESAFFRFLQQLT